MSLNYKKGDVLESKYEKLKILETSYVEVDGERIYLYITKDPNDNDGFLTTYTDDELKEDGFSDPADVKEMTVEEVQEKLGHKVKIVESR